MYTFAFRYEFKKVCIGLVNDNALNRWPLSPKILMTLKCLSPWLKKLIHNTTHDSKTSMTDSKYGIHLWNAPEPDYWQVNIGSGNGLVPSGNKPLHGPMLTQIWDYYT